MITIDPPSSLPPPHPALSKTTLTRFLNRARTAIGLSGQVDVLLTTDAELKRLNRTFRGMDKPTDVLSFPPFSETDPIPGLPTEAAQHAHAGDLAISLDTAARQAARFGHSLDLELRILLLHGLLHLAGHDHETDSGEMAALEANLRTKLKLPATLIDRTLTSRTTTTAGAPRPASGTWEGGAPNSRSPRPRTGPTQPARKTRGPR